MSLRTGSADSHVRNASLALQRAHCRLPPHKAPWIPLRPRLGDRQARIFDPSPGADARHVAAGRGGERHRPNRGSVGPARQVPPDWQRNAEIEVENTYNRPLTDPSAAYGKRPNRKQRVVNREKSI